MIVKTVKTKPFYHIYAAKVNNFPGIVNCSSAMAKSISVARSLSRPRSASKSQPRQKAPVSQKADNFWYQPHYITGLVALLGYLFYLAFIKSDSGQDSMFK